MCGWRTASPSIEKADRFAVRTDKGDFEAGAVVLATGGLSIPKMGATGFAHDTARRFGLEDHADAAGAGAVHARRCRS